MKLIYKNIILTGILAVGSLAGTSCSNWLDMKPLDEVTPESYFQNSDQLGAYAISQYNSLFSMPSGWSQGSLITGDGDTDNMVYGAMNQNRFTKNIWQVSQSGDLGFSLIRYCNYFFETVLPRYESGFYGDDAMARHYIGEMYFIRAWVYFSRLKTYGDYPIVTDVLLDQKEDLIAHGKRMPRNEVADFILSDLDNAISMLQSIDEGANKVRINKEVAQLVKSRVALYEASYETYHRGTGRVPGDQGWPGFRVHPDYSFDVDAHVNDLLTQAMEAAKAVADKVTLTANSGVYEVEDPTAVTAGWNPYFEMYCSYDLNSVDEVLMWKAYGQVSTSNITHGVCSFAITGGSSGLLKGYVESFLMKDGMPIYNATAENPYLGDETLDNVKANRDGRLQLFMFGESNWLPTDDRGFSKYHFTPVLIPARQGASTGDPTGYRIRKGMSFDVQNNTYGKAEGTTAQIIFRGVEAYLNYIEAQYMRDGNLDGVSSDYWRRVRERAGVDGDFNKTIAATDMTREAVGDWGAYSAGSLIDPTLYNIRRERRCEFIGEAMRWDDLVRWCAMDQLKEKNFIPEGCNFWTSMYRTAIYNEDHNEVEFIQYPAEDANISSSGQSMYVLPYGNNEANVGFNGYTWMNAHYNSPIPIREIQLLSETESVDNSVMYQTWGWPLETGLPAEQ